MTNQATAYWTQGVGPQQGQAAYGTPASAQPSWEAYYDWAKQLYASGDTTQGDVYYRHAQLLYEQVQARRQMHHTQAYPTSSNTSPGIPRITTDIHARYSAAPWASSTAAAMGAKRPNRSLKIWVVSSLVIGLVIVAGGIIGLLHSNKYPLRQWIGHPSKNGVVSTWVEEVGVKPMVGVIQPVFSKIIRLSLAAQPVIPELNRLWLASQPLLFELKLRDVPPEAQYAASSKKAEHVGVKAASLAPSFESNNAIPINEIGSPSAADAAKNTEAPPTADDGTGAKERLGSENDNAASATTIDSNSDAQAEAASKDAAESSPTESKRSHRHRSNHSFSRAESNPESNDIRPVESAAPTALGNSSAEGGPAWVENTPPTASNAKTKDLDALLAPKQKTPAGSLKSQEVPAVKESLSRADVQQGMAMVTAAVKRCGQGSSGTVSINITIAPNGRISRAVTSGEYAGTPVGTCAERAVMQARFPESLQTLAVKYPIAL